MDYKKIYKNIIENAKNNDRKKGNGIYYESHHIIPDFMFKERKRKGPSGHLPGNPNDKNNIVLLTPREHLLCHVLLLKFLKNTHYCYAAASALSFFFTKVMNNTHPRFVAGISKKYDRYRLLGIDGISKARKGKMPVIDAITRESIGSVDTNHPKVLSGEWVHSTKGRKASTKEIQKIKERYTGSTNPNYKELSEDRLDRLLVCVSKSIIENHLLKKELEKNIKKEFTEFKKISIIWINNHIPIEKLLDIYNERNNTNVVYNPYFRSSDQRKNSSMKNKEYTWYTNGKENIRLHIYDVIPENFYKGRI